MKILWMTYSLYSGVTLERQDVRNNDQQCSIWKKQSFSLCINLPSKILNRIYQTWKIIWKGASIWSKDYLVKILYSSSYYCCSLQVSIPCIMGIIFSDANVKTLIFIEFWVKSEIHKTDIWNKSFFVLDQVNTYNFKRLLSQIYSFFLFENQKKWLEKIIPFK